MILKVNPHKIDVLEKEPVNEREINVSKCQFVFADEMPDNMVKEAYFTFEGSTYKQIIVDNECEIPSEVLAKKGTVEIGVVPFKLVNGEYEVLYNPLPVYIKTWSGSLKDNVENSVPLTPSDKEQIEQAIIDLENNKQDSLVSGENIKTINGKSVLGEGNIEVGIDPDEYYTKSETNLLLNDKVDTTAYVHKQATQDANITENASNINELQSLVNQLPTVEEKGTDISLQDVLNFRFKKLDLFGNSSQDGEPTPDSPYPVKVVTGENSIVVQNENLFDKNNANKLNVQIDRNALKLIENSSARTLWIKIQPNSTYTVSKISSARFRIATLQAQPIINADLTKYESDDSGTTLTITSEANDHYLAVMYYNSTVDTLTEQQILDSIMIAKGSTAPSTYVEHEEQNYQLSLGNIELNSSPDGTIRDQIVGKPNEWYKREYIGKTTDVSGSTSITINDMVSNGGFYSYYGGTLNGKTITYASAISGTNTILYQKSQYTDIPITDTTLINQLNNIYNNAHSYKGVTNITSTYADENEQMIIDASALMDIGKKLENI